jgi:predicted NAD/FAD-dependent oxidoreductase
MALVGLLTLEQDMNLGPNGYQEFQSCDFFSIADQKAKGLSNIPALTVTMSPEFSENNFDQPDEHTLNKILDAVKTQFPEIKIKEAELKKWRFCRPNSCYKDYFAEISPRLFLIGDAFGGASLSGALRSSNALCHFLQKAL